NGTRSRYGPYGIEQKSKALLRRHRRRQLKIVPVGILECGEQHLGGLTFAAGLIWLRNDRDAQALDALELALHVRCFEVDDESARHLVPPLHLGVRTDHQIRVPRLPADVAALLPRRLSE